MTINNSTGARVPWLLLFWLAGIPFSVHSQERDKPKVSKPPAVTEDRDHGFSRREKANALRPRFFPGRGRSTATFKVLIN